MGDSSGNQRYEKSYECGAVDLSKENRLSAAAFIITILIESGTEDKDYWEIKIAVPRISQNRFFLKLPGLGKSEISRQATSSQGIEKRKHSIFDYDTRKLLNTPL